MKPICAPLIGSNTDNNKRACRQAPWSYLYTSIYAISIHWSIDLYR